MKLPSIAFALITSLIVTNSLVTPVYAHSAASEKRTAGPNGGRVITKVTPHVEFLVMADRKVKLTFLDDAGKPVELAAQTATLTGGDRANPTKLAFAKEGDALVSDKALPEGASVPVVLQIKVTPDAQTVTEKISVNLAKCPECSYAEYACTCDH